MSWKHLKTKRVLQDAVRAIWIEPLEERRSRKGDIPTYLEAERGKQKGGHSYLFEIARGVDYPPSSCPDTLAKSRITGFTTCSIAATEEWPSFANAAISRRSSSCWKRAGGAWACGSSAIV